MTDSSAYDSPKPTDKGEAEVRNLRLNYRSSTNTKRIKTHRPSSDDESFSSSLLPIPDNLRQKGGDLKKIVSDVEEATEVEYSSNSVYDVTDNFPNSLHELRRKYSLKNESSVTMKMNSANIMLDDILNGGNNMSETKSESFQSKFYPDHDLKVKKIQKSICSPLAESQHCDHTLAPITVHCGLASPYDLTQHYCQRHDQSSMPSCICSNFHEKGSQHREDDDKEGKPRKLSFFDKFQNMDLKYKIHSVYKIVQNSNPFIKDRKHSAGLSISQGIPSSKYTDNLDIMDRKRDKCKCIDCKCSGRHYPKRMIFDLIESSDSIQSESSRREEKSDSSPLEINCTCPSQIECNCPEVPECICEQHHDEPLRFVPTVSRSVQHHPIDLPPTQKLNEYAQTESFNISFVQNNEKEVEVSSEAKNIKSIPAIKPTELKNETRENENENRGSNKLQQKSSNKEYKRYCRKERKLIERTDIYYFDHGNSSYYRTTDNHPIRYTECLVERTDEYATRFWGEFFGFFEIGMSFLISFILQFYRFCFTSIIRSLTVGLLQIFSDYFFKPLLTISFNGILQPCLILAYNIATSLRDLSLPFSQIFGFFTKEVANLFRSCRLVEINNNNCRLPTCQCGNKV